MFLVLSIFVTLAITPLVINGLDKSLSKAIVFLFGFFVFFIISFNGQNNDYDAYVQMFDDPSQYAEFGYSFLVEFLKYIGFETHQSVLLVLSLLVVLTLINISSQSKYFALFLILYIAFLLPLDVTQIRNAFCVFFVLNAMIAFSRGNFLQFILFWILALSFHYIGLIFGLLILLGRFLETLGRLKLFVVLILMVTSFYVAYVIINSPLTYSLRTLDNYIAEGKISSVIMWSGVVVSYILTFYALTHRAQHHTSISLSGRSDYIDLKLTALTFNIIIASLVFVAGLYFIFEFNRVYRFIMMVMMLHASLVSAKLTWGRRFLLFSYFCFVYYGLAYFYSSKLNYDYIIFGGFLY